MAYGLKYNLRFKNRIQNDYYRVEIWEKDYVGDPTDLTGSDNPFTANWQETDILSPIKSCEFTINFITDNLQIEDFYSDDDEQFRIDLYFESDSNGGGTEKLLHTGFLIQDGASEPVTDRKHIITLKASDNLALLKSVKWNEIDNDYFGKFPLSYYFRYCIKQTGLYSNDVLLDMSLPLRLYGNIFENTTDDRGDDAENDPYKETILHSGMFQNTNSEWDDCYTILEKILGSLNACIIQADGYWNILRIPEYQLFEDGQILGTEYIYNGSGTDVNAITLDPLATIDRTGANVYPVAEDQSKSILRPYKYILDTFEYNQPVLIIQSDLQIPSDAVPYDTATDAGIRTDKYDLATYFPDWFQRNGDTSYLVIETDTTVSPEQEKDRFIVTTYVGGSSGDVIAGVQFNPLVVSRNDRIDLSISWKTYPLDTDSQCPFWIRFLLITATDIYNLVQYPDEDTGSPPAHDPDNKRLSWEIIDDNTLWDSSSEGVLHFVVQSIAEVTDMTKYQFYQLSDRTIGVVPPIPVDGVLLIEVLGNNNNAFDGHDYGWKDIRLTITNFINESIQITGQTHKDTGTSTIKAISENTINIDDSPRSTIAGTLFTDELTTFSYTDSVSGEDTDLGNIYFNRTVNWHRSGNSEALRLGNIISQERLQIRNISRLIIEGTFRNLRYDTDKFISLLSLFQIGFYTDKNFVAAGMEINYMDCSFKAPLNEIYNTVDIENVAVFLTGVKNSETSITTGYIEYDTITNYGGVEGYIDVTDSNSKFTYVSDFDTTVNFSATFFVPISGSGTATFTVEKNGGVIATETVDAIEVFKRIDFDLIESVTDTDYFQIHVDPGSADVDIQSGSLNIEVNDVMSTINFPYQFNYLYKTN